MFFVGSSLLEIGCQVFDKLRHGTLVFTRIKYTFWFAKSLPPFSAPRSNRRLNERGRIRRSIGFDFKLRKGNLDLKKEAFKTFLNIRIEFEGRKVDELLRITEAS
mmetsp:Transcript_18308/g.26041  ORF Transcript_18308/g.26041 Transcript_18308/m.26041 type:complete len:105 (+) Transcript_18308:1185-1499(+)